MKEKQFKKLMAVRKERQVLVTRNSKTITISAYDLLVGDII
jgi:magnesium-transporting ATPase (P-type)